MKEDTDGRLRAEVVCGRLQPNEPLVLAASLERERRELVKREKLRAGELSYDLDGLRKRLEGAP